MERLHLRAAAAGHDGASPPAVETAAVDGDVAGRGREVRDLAPLFGRGRQEGRLHREPGHLAGQHAERREAVHRRVVVPPHGELELVAQLIERAAVHAADRRLEGVVAVLFLVHRRHPPVAVRIGEPAMDLTADRIDDPAGDIGELAQRGKPAAQRQVPHHHLVPRVLTSGPELRQPLGPPEREIEAAVTGGLEIRLAQQVELEDVHHLVPERVPKLGEVPAEREGDPPLEEVGGAEQPFRWGERQDVGLLEVRVRRVDHERHPLGHVVPELDGQRVVARLGMGQGRGRELGFRGIVVEIHVRAAKDAPVQLAILDLVLAEAEELRVGRPRREGAEHAGEQKKRDRSRQQRHGPPHFILIVRIRSPWVIRARLGSPVVTRPKIV